MDPTRAAAITITGRMAYDHANMPYFEPTVLAHGGYFVRVKRHNRPEVGASDDGYMWTRITHVYRKVEPQWWKKKAFDYVLKVEGIEDFVELQHLSDKPPTEANIEAYRELAAALGAPDLQAIADQADGMIATLKATFTSKRAMSTEEARAIMQMNTRLGRSSFNLAREISTTTFSAIKELSTTGGSQAAPQESPLSTQGSQMMSPSAAAPVVADPLLGGSGLLDSQREGTMAMLGSTAAPSMQEIGRSSSSVGGATGKYVLTDAPFFTDEDLEWNPTLRAKVNELRAKSDSFEGYVTTEARMQDDRSLVALTNRNKAKNTSVRIMAEEVKKTMPKSRSNLQESGLLWVVDHEKRKQLCEDFEKKDKKKEEEKKNEAAAAAAAAAVQTAEDDASLNRVDSLQRSCSQISDDVLVAAHRAVEGDQPLSQRMISASQGMLLMRLAASSSPSVLRSRVASQRPEDGSQKRTRSASDANPAPSAAVRR